MIDAEEIGLIFKGGVHWEKVIATNKRARLALVSPRRQEEPEETPAERPAPTSPSAGARPDKAAILRRLRAKAG